jgi:hypothetical protein
MDLTIKSKHSLKHHQQSNSCSKEQQQQQQQSFTKSSVLYSNSVISDITEDNDGDDDEDWHVIVAETTKSNVLTIKVPYGLVAGDSFLVTELNGDVFTVIVPTNAHAGCLIEVVLPINTNNINYERNIEKNKIALSALGFGGVIGCYILGPIVGFLAGTSLAYATSKQGKIGDYYIYQ